MEKSKVAGSDYTVHATINQRNNQAIEVDLSSNGQGSPPQGTNINGEDASSRYMPTHASYGGGSTLEYTVNDQQKMASLD